jgi:hypothetical protein
VEAAAALSADFHGVQAVTAATPVSGVSAATRVLL